MSQSLTSNRTQSKLIGILASTAVAILSAPLHYRALQRNLIKVILSFNSSEEKVTLSDQAKRDLN